MANDDEALRQRSPLMERVGVSSEIKGASGGMMCQLI